MKIVTDVVTQWIGTDPAMMATLLAARRSEMARLAEVLAALGVNSEEQAEESAEGGKGGSAL